MSRPDSPDVTEPALVLGRGQAQAPNPLPRTKLPPRFRPRPMTDSLALHPLLSISLPFRRSPVRPAPAFPFHCVPTAANWRDSHESIVRARRTKMTARLRPASKQVARDASHGQEIVIRREAPPVAEGMAIAAGTVQLSRHSAGCACETDRPHWSNILVGMHQSMPNRTELRRPVPN
jgi:hypothetical protein